MFQINNVYITPIFVVNNLDNQSDFCEQRYQQRCQHIVLYNMQNVMTTVSQKISQCASILIGAGAGMGKDSGLPDFRGHDGFWNNYPPYRNKFNFYQCANPQFLQTHPDLFWGFYGHRLTMYRDKKPHQGFNILKELCQKAQNYFVITSNVDGHFQRVFNESKIYQVHGSINYLQCYNCGQIFQNKFQPKIDLDKMSCQNVPSCEKCKQNLRPNILMFGDWSWISDRSDQQANQYRKFLKSLKTKQQSEKQKLAIIQIGCGTAVPTIRNMCQNAYHHNKNSIYIRINPDQEDNTKHMNKERFFHIKQGALSALTQIKKQLQSKNVGSKKL